MFWLHCGLFVLVIAVPGFISSADSTSKREADYTLDDSFWNEETPAGEVERLLRRYRQNQELIQNIGTHDHQIIYPVQLRHHEKMGISTREVSVSKFPQRGYGEGGYQNTRGRIRTGRHFHRTSLLIRAFNHKFRLDLELNTQLLAPNLEQKDYLANDVEQSSKEEIEHCYYHGTVKDYPGASAAFHTCNGVSGVIHLGNETFVIHPFYGGDLSKHPHVIFEARTKVNPGCANTGNVNLGTSNLVNLNSGNFEWRAKNRRQKHVLGLSETISDRYKRDVREATKYIETAIIIDKAMFEKRNGSTRAEVVHDAIQVVNIVDMYFRSLNTRVSITYIETWQGKNQASIVTGMDIANALQILNNYTRRMMFRVQHDTTQLLTGETFLGGMSGVAALSAICKKTSIGISVDLNTYEPHLLAGTMAHMIGHNIGMSHDEGRNCTCREWHGCIMAKKIVGVSNVQPYTFSECSKKDYTELLRDGDAICLMNKPNELERRSCGDEVINDGEQCDCGTVDECKKKDPCCDPITCKLITEAKCATGPCCINCKLLARGVVCRESTNECDLPEVCTGETGQCPTNVYKKNGSPCSNNGGYCYNGVCTALDLQCEQIWGYGGIAADKQCFEQFNSKGSLNGHCGTNSSGQYLKCEPHNIHCGSLQCQKGRKKPVVDGIDHSRTIISIKGEEYECKSTTGKVEKSEMPDMGLVLDGTSCGDNSVCVNQTCTSLFPLIDKNKCPSNHNNNECSGNGVCTNVNKCYCNPGWSGPDCSIKQDIPTFPPTTARPETPDTNNSTTAKPARKETPYENYHGSNTVFLVGVLMSVVGGVFIVFALMALCYRSVVVHKNYSLCLRRKSTVQKYDQPYTKKLPQRNHSNVSENHHRGHEVLDNMNSKIFTYNSMPNYSRSDNQRVIFRAPNNVTTTEGPRVKEHKSQMKRLVISEEDGGTGAEEAVSFIDLQPNNLSKFPEKGILKKHSDYGGGTATAVACPLEQLNGYHEHIIEALRHAATHIDTSGTPSGSGNPMDDEGLMENLTEPLAERGYLTDDGYREDIGGQEHIDNQVDEEYGPPCNTFRIRTLEDLIKQLDRHARHSSPCDSEDIRMSESEPDRHYRIDSSVCSESSQGSRRCTRARDDTYGRYCQPSSRSPYGTHQLTQHSHQMHKEEGIYETADPDRGSNTRGETPDSESDAFIQAQQQLARWTNEDGVQHRPSQQPPPPSTMIGVAIPLLQHHRSQREHRHQQQQQQQQQQRCHHAQPQQQQQQQQQQQPQSSSQQQQEQHQLPVEQQLPIQQRGYYPSPPHTTDNCLENDETENAQSHQKQQKLPDVRGIDVNHLPNINKCPLDDNFSLDCNINNGSPKELNTNNTSDNENTALLPPSHFPEYKH